jgi:hypothetical protein
VEPSSERRLAGITFACLPELPTQQMPQFSDLWSRAVQENDQAYKLVVASESPLCRTLSGHIRRGYALETRLQKGLDPRMLSKRLRERIRLLPHESEHVTRGSLKAAEAGDLKPGGRQNLPQDIDDHAVRLLRPGQPPRRGVLKPQDSSPETSPPLEVRDSPQSDRAGLLQGFRG